jgi:hypothetical protein
MKEKSEELLKIVHDAELFLSRISKEKSESIPGTSWTIKEIIGHLIDSACNNHQRYIRLQAGALIDFPDYDQNSWVDSAGYKNLDWQDILNLWISYNTVLAGIIANIDESYLNNYWKKKEITLEFLINDYIRHINHHLDQIKNVL